jgi:hypothetical protein
LPSFPVTAVFIEPTIGSRVSVRIHEAIYRIL